MREIIRCRVVSWLFEDLQRYISFMLVFGVTSRIGDRFINWVLLTIIWNKLCVVRVNLLMLIVRVFTTDVLLHSLIDMDLWLDSIFWSSMSINKPDLRAEVSSRLHTHHASFARLDIRLCCRSIILVHFSSRDWNVILRLNLRLFAAKRGWHDVWFDIGILGCIITDVDWTINVWDARLRFGLFRLVPRLSRLFRLGSRIRLLVSWRFLGCFARYMLLALTFLWC